MSLLRQDGPDDVVGAGIEGAMAGWQIGRIIMLAIAVIGIALFYVLKFVIPLVIRFLAFVLPILWRLLGQVCRWCVSAAAAGISAMKARFAGNTSS